jgi:hypothetical protein
MRADALRDYGAWRGLVAEAVRLGIASDRFATQSTPERIAVLTIALVDGVGIPLALGDPQVTERGAIEDVLSALDQLLRPQAAAPGAMDRAQRL